MWNNFFTKFLLEFAKRMTNKSPKFFRVLQVIAVILGASSAAVIWLSGQGYQLPEWLLKIGDLQVIINALIVALVSQLPVEDKSVIEDKHAVEEGV